MACSIRSRKSIAAMGIRRKPFHPRLCAILRRAQQWGIPPYRGFLTRLADRPVGDACGRSMLGNTNVSIRPTRGAFMFRFSQLRPWPVVVVIATLVLLAGLAGQA